MAYDADAPSSTAEVESGALILDPEASDRQYYSDPYTGIQREIWRPGRFPSNLVITASSY